MSQSNINTDDCWLYAGKLNIDGYGRVAEQHTAYYIHRVMYENYVQEIPEGLQIDHLCRVRHCINPAHLEAVTLQENMFRGESLQARNARKTHCKRGHEFTPNNTNKGIRRGKPTRGCKTCIRIYMRAYYHKNKVLN